MTSFLRVRRRPLCTLMVGLLAFHQVAQPLQAVTIYWDGSTSGAWNTQANWNTAANGSGPATGVVVGSGNDLVFVVSAGAANLTQTLGASTTVRSLTFNSSLTSNLAISGNTLTLTPSGTGLTPTGTAIDMTTAGANVSIASAVTLGADQTWLLGTGRTLAITGAFTADANDDLIVSGAGILQLGNATDNSYSIGSITLQNGATMVNTLDNPFGDTVTVINMSAGTTWDKGGFTDAFRGLTGTGSVINAGNLDFRTVTGDTFTFSGTVSGPVGADLIRQGTAEMGTQIMAGDVTFDDQLLVYAGTLGLANVNGAANQIAGLILMGRTDASTVRRSAAVPLATLLLDSSAGNHVSQNRLRDDEELQFRATGHFQMIGNATALTTENIGAINVTESNVIDAHGIVTLVDGGAGVALTSDQFIRSAGSTLLVRGTGLGTAAAGVGVTNLIFDVTAPTITGTLGTTNVGVIAGMLGDVSTTGSGSGLVTYGANGVRLLNASEYAATFTGAGENVLLTASQTLGGSLIDLTATLSGAGVTLDLGGHVLGLNGASILSNGTAAGTITNGTINFGAATEGFIYIPQDLNLNASITGATALTITGPGTLTISQPQSYTGQTSLTQGNLVVNGSFILPATRFNAEGTVTFAGTNTYNRVGNVSGSILSLVELNDNTLEMVGLADTNMYGQITGTSSSVLIKSGGNTFTQRSLNSAFLGSVIVRGGTFRLLGDTNSATSVAAGTLSGASSFLVETGGTLTLDNQTGADSRAINNRIGDGASVALNRGTFIITGSNNARPVEVIADLVLQGGYNTITLDADFGSSSASNTSHGDVVLTANQLVRNNFATALVRGDNLGFALGGIADSTTAANLTGGEAGDPGGAEANLTFTNAPVLSGTGTGAAIGVIPYLTGGMTAALNGSTAGGASLVTMGANGIRMLDISPTTTDYAYSVYTANTALSAASITGNNVYLDINADNSDVLLGGPAVIGGLVIDNAGGAGSDVLLQGNLLTIASGIILSTGTQTNTITAGGAGGQLTFGPNAATGYEGRIHGARRIEVAAPIVDNGSNAVSITTDGEVYYNVANTYTGPTVINSGRIEIGTGDNLMPIATVLTINGDGALRLFGGSQEIGGLRGVGFVENQNTTIVRTLTINTDSALDDFTFSGVLRNGAAAVLNIVKTGIGKQTFSGQTASTTTGSLTVANGTLVLDGGMTSNSGQTFLDNRFVATVPVTIGAGATSAVLQLGGPSGALNQTVASLISAGTGTANAVVGGNAAFSTLTINQSANATFNGAIGGPGTFQNNLNLVKNGAFEQVVGAATHAGTTTVNAGKLFYDGFGGASVTTGRLTLADGTEFSLRGTSPSSNSVYSFSGTGNVVTVGSATGATLGFALDGAFNTQINLAAGQTMLVNGALTTAIYVNGAPVAGQGYVLINGADDNSIFGTGSFSLNPVVFNGGSFTYALSQVTAGAGEQWVLTPTAQAAAADVWWKGDLTGIAAGVWSASLSSGTGSPTNWDTTQSGGVDALVPPDSGSIVHFSATGAANFTTTLGADLTIQELIFHAGSSAISIGSSGGTNTLTLGNTVDTTGLTLLTGAPNVSISANVALAQVQTWNITDAVSVLTLSGGLSGVGPLTLNGNGSSTGTLVLSGVNGLATYTGGTNLVTGRLVLGGGANNRLPAADTLTMGNATLGAVLQLGDAAGASSNTIGDLIVGAATTNRIVGGAAAVSTLTVNQNTASTYTGTIGGAGTNENNVAVVKQGTATWIWSGIVTHTGGTSVRTGVLQLGSTASMTGSGPLTVNATAGAAASFDVNGKAISTTTITLGGADSTAAPSITDTATGGSITLGGNVVYDATNNPLGAILDVDFIIANDNRNFTAGNSTNAAADLTINGTITATGYATDERVAFDGAGTIVLNGAVSVVGSGSDLQKNGVGTLVINAATAPADDWLINEGVVNANVSNALNATDNVIIDGTGVQDSAIVNIDGTAGDLGVQQGNDFYIRNGGRVNVLVNNGISTGTDLLLVGDSASIGPAAAGRLHLAANISSTSFQVGASGGQIGNVTGIGSITANGGFSLRGGSIGDGIILAGTGGITKVGNGTLTFSGTRATTGNTAVQEGHLILDYSTNNDSKIGGVLTLGVANVGTLTAPVSLTLNGNAAGTTQSVTSTTVERSGDVSVFLNDAGGGVTLSLGAITRTQLGGTLSLQYSGANAAVTTTSPAASQLGWATLAVGGITRFASIDGTGKFVQAATTLQNDIAQWLPTANIVNDAAYTGMVPAGSTVAIATLTFDASSGIDIGSGGVLTIGSGGILVADTVGASSTIINGGSLMSGAASPAGELIIHQNSTGTLIITSSIQNSGGITKSGTGTLVLSGTNSFAASGSRLTINEGTVRISGGNAIGDTTALVMRNGATLDLDNSTETVGSIGIDTTNFSHGAILVGTGALTINQTASSSYYGGISGSGSITKNANGVLTLEGNSSFSGTVTVNAGRWDLRGDGGFMNAATTFVLNRAELLSYQNSSTQRDRIGNDADIILNNTGGTQGLYLLTNQGNTKAENIGDIRIGAGHNVISSHGNATNAVSDLISDTLVRLNNAGQNHGTVLVRGNALGASTGQRGLIRFEAAAQATIDAYEVGGGATSGSTISIIPWMVGDLSQTGLGNSFVTNTGTVDGLRPLASTEYLNDSTTLTGALTDNVRYTASATITGAPTAINSLVLDGAAATTLAGPASSLAITSGAILSARAVSNTINTFTALTTGGGRDYTVFVTDPAGTLTLGSALTSAVPLVKSGAGTLSLTNTGNAFTDIYLNQGFVLVDDANKLGSGKLVFSGGGVRLAAGFTGDLTTKVWDISTGGGFLDVSQVTANSGVAFLNGIQDSTPNSADTFTIITRSSASAGQLVIQGASTFTGTTVINHVLDSPIATAVLLNGTTNLAINGNLHIGTQGTLANNNLDVVVGLGANEQIADTASITFNSTAGEEAYFKLFGFTETVAGISSLSRGVVENHESDADTVAASGKLIVNSSQDFSFNGFLRDRASGTIASGVLAFEKQGTGTQMLIGASILHTGVTTITGGTLHLQSTSAWNSEIINNSVLIIEDTAARTQAKNITGSGNLIKLGGGVLTLSGADVGYTGTTTIRAGTLDVTGGNFATTGLQVDAGAGLRLVNGVGAALNLSALELGSGNQGPITLGLEIGSPAAYDRFIVSGMATTLGTINFDLVGLAGFQAGDYDLITASGGLDTALYSISSFSGVGGFTYALTSSPTYVRLTATALAPGDLYWRGGVSNSWSTVGAGMQTNFTTDLAGNVNSNSIPGIGNRVIFSASGATGPAITTLLNGSFSIADLEFIASPTGVASVSIAPGTPANSSLTITPSVDTDGIDVAANAGAITISAPLVLGGSQTWNVNGTGSSLAISGGSSGTGNLTKAGAGTLTLSGAHTYVGTTTVSGGVLQAGATNGFNQTSAHIIASGATLRLNNFAAVIGSLAGAGTVENGSAGTAARILTAGGDNSSTTFSGVLQDGGPFALSLTKTGTGALTLSGASIHTGTTTVSNGTLNVTGSIIGNTTSSTLAFGGSANKTIVNVSGDMTLFSLTAGNVNGSTAVYNQTAGNVFVQGNGSSATYVANAAGSYGYFNLTGGTFKGATRFALSLGSSLTTQATSVLYIGGNGFLDLRNSEWMLNYSHGQLTVAGNGVVDRSGATASYGIMMNSNVPGSVYGVLNVAGGSFLTTTQPLRFGNSTTAGAGNNNTAFVNLAGGLLQVGVPMSVSLPADGANNAYLNFAGGTLKTSAAITNWIPASTGAITFTSTLFGAVDNSALAGAPSFTGGLVFDSNGFNSSLNAVLKGATGNGVTQADLTVVGGTGYIGAPEVIFSSAGLVAGGTPAAGYALIENGSVVGIVITSPGTYVPGTTPTVTLTGGGGTGASVTTGALNIANTSGGLTKIGAGMLTLSGANTYTGGTQINAGTLALGASSVLADTGSVTVNGGILDIGVFTDTVGLVTLQDGSINGTLGFLTSTADYELHNGTVSAVLSGSVGVNKTTAGTVTLSGANNFTGGVNVSQGTLILSGANNFAGAVSVGPGTVAFSASNNLGNASATNTLAVNGGTLNFTGASAVDLGANRVLTIGAAGATVDVTSTVGVLTLPAISGSSTGSLVKTGAGTLIVSAPISLNGGAGSATISNGTLRASFGTGGISALTVGADGVLSLQNSLAEVLTLGSTPGALTLIGGSRLGLELGAPGISDAIASGGLASVSGVITLDLLNLGSLGAGTYTLLQAAGGLDNATYVLGAAPSGFNYTINVTGSQVTLDTSVLVARYWTGLQGGSWATVNPGPATNWSLTANGFNEAGDVPGAAHTVIFSGGNVTGSTIATTLDAAFTVDSLQFLNVPATITSVSIAPGTGGSLTLAPVSPTNGILVAANGGAVSISAPLTVGAPQTWNVNGTGASSLVLSGPVTFGSAVTKRGAGALTLSGANTGAGGLTLFAGTLNINSVTALGTGPLTIETGTTINNSSAAALTLTTNNAQAWNGSFTFTGTQSLNMGTGPVTLNASITATVSASTLTIGGSITEAAGSRALTKEGAGILVLSGANTFSGGLTLNTGGLTINNASALGSGTFTINGGTIDNTTAAPITTGNNPLVWNNAFTFTGTRSLNLGTGGVLLGSNVTLTTTASTLTAGPVSDDAGVFGITKLGAGTLELAGVSTYDGATVIDRGTLRFLSGTQNLTAVSNTLTFGATAGAANTVVLDLTNSSATFGGAFLVQTLNATAGSANSITLGAGQTLQVNGAFTLGYNSAASSFTRLNITGATGTFSIGAPGAPTNANVQIGNGAITNMTNAGILDMSGLGTFYANLGSGTFRVGDPTNSGGSGPNGSVLTLAANSTITATLITSDSPSSIIQTIKLGSGTNVFNATTITIGGSSGRATGILDFNTTTGTLKIRGLAGDDASRATLNVQNGGATTAGNLVGTVNLVGHNADLLLSTLTIGGRSAQVTGSGTGTFSFDTGVLNATTVVVATRTGSTATTGTVTGTLNLNEAVGTTGAVTIGTLNMAVNSASTATTSNQALATLNIGGSGTVGITTMTMANNSIGGGATAQTSVPVSSTVNISGSTTTIGTLSMNVNSSANTGTNNASVSTLNITGGSVIIGAGGINMANASNAAATATSVISLTGGSLTLGGNLTYTAGVGTENTTLTLAGGILNMGGFSIGSATSIVGSGTGSLSFESGTLQNVAQINNGAGLAKTTTGTLVLEGTNTYTGGTTISGGVLQVGTGSTTGTLGSGTVTNNATLTFNRSNSYTVGDVITGSGTVIQAGSGTTVLSGTNTYTGQTTITGGRLSIASESNLGSDPLASAANHLSLNGGTLFTTATLAIDDTNRGITVGPAGGAFEVASGTTTTITNVITGNGALAKEGAGTLIFTNTNTNTGPTSVNAGVLGGTGTVGGSLTVNNTGILAPGVTGAGVLTVTGNLVINGGGTLSNELGGPTFNAAAVVLNEISTNGNLNAFVGNLPSTDWENYISGTTAHDHLQINGASASVVNGTVKISALLGGYTPAYGDIFDLLDWTFVGSLTGTPTYDFSDVSLSPGLGFNTDLFLSNGIIVVVPEPSRALFLLLGLLGFMLRRRRR